MLELLTTILTAYLAVTNALADRIDAWLPDQSSDIAAETESLTPLTSRLTAIPDILLQNAAYQGAQAIYSQQYQTTDALEAVVNIFCQFESNDQLRSITGTGFFIDSKGVILTNAHVAQFLILEGIYGEAECTIRSGNPAVPKYTADLLYIPPAWIVEHAAMIDAETPSGTGERDYALLYVTGTVDGTATPAFYPALPLDSTLLPLSVIGDKIISTGYPAESLFAAGDPDVALIPQQANTNIGELLTFESQYSDVFSLLGTSMGERGASGGPVQNSSGNVIGMISTRGDDDVFGAGSLRAITVSYIDRTMQQETNLTLTQTMQSDLAQRSSVYKRVMVPLLAEQLLDELE